MGAIPRLKPGAAEVSMGVVLGIDVGLKNLALCAVEPGTDPFGRDDVVCFWTVVSTLPGPAALIGTLHDSALDDVLPRVARVVIERQPTKNVKATTLMRYLEMYFAMRGKPTELIEPRHKLDFAAASPWWPGDPPSWTYHFRKKMAVNTVARFLAGTDQGSFAEVFADSPKRDDLADSLLHALAASHWTAAAPRRPTLPTTVPRPRKPTAAQAARGMSRANVVWVSRQPGALDSPEAFAAAVKSAKATRAVTKWYVSMDHAFKVLSGHKQSSTDAGDSGCGFLDSDASGDSG